MVSPLPMTLRVYRRLSAAAAPLAPALIKRRLKQGKEDPARVGERRGMSTDIRPHGPLVWIHGASVGEVLAAAALIEKLRALNIRILLTSGTVTSAAIVAKRFPPDIIHQYVPYDSPRYVARFLDHWRPITRAVHRIRPVAQPDPVERGAALADGADQRPDVASLVSALAQGERHDLGVARPVRCLPGAIAGRCGTLFRTRQPQRRHHRQSETRCSGAARRFHQTGAIDVGDARPPDRSWRRRRIPARKRYCSSAPHAVRVFSLAADGDRAAASRPRRGDRADGRGLRPARRLAFARGTADRGHRHLCRRHHGRNGAVLPAVAGRVHGRIAGRTWRTKSDRGGQARRLDRSRPSRLQFLPTSTRRSTVPAAPGGRKPGKRWSSSSASCWRIRPRATLSVAAAERVVSQLGGALDRTLAALEPYLLQLRLEMGAADA